jgi:RimJ/RimL family protein N-acetyltransferase
VGFYEDKALVAVMDLIDGYPNADIAYIGFFMMNPIYQGNQIGTAIISEVIDYLRSIGKKAVRLAIDKGNPQSTHFWKKNGFEIISEADVNGWTKLVAEKQL